MSSQSPPNGPFTTQAVLLSGDDALSMQGTQFTDGSLGPSVLRANVMARDPYTNDLVRLSGVPVQRPAGTSLEGFSEQQKFTLHCPDYSAFKRRSVGQMTLEPAPADPVTQNLAIPQPVRVKNRIDSFTAHPSATCRAFNENQERVHRAMGLIHNRDDVSILQGRQNGRSPGVLVHQQDGRIVMFDASGRQHVELDGRRLRTNVTGIDTGTANIERNTINYGGLDQMENPVNDVVPQGTILSPQPKTIPYVSKILNTILPIMDMIDLVNCCAQAAKVITSKQGSSGEVLQQAQESSLENAYYNESEDATNGRRRS